MKNKISLKEKFQYHFDNLMAKGTISLVGLLFGITFLVVTIAGILCVLFDTTDTLTVGQGLWISLMHAIDAGTITADDGPFLFMFLMTLVTICGLFITSVLIGIVNTGMEMKMESLRKGKSRILEEEHTVILGFNAATYTLLTELIEANANQKRGVVVVMDEKKEKEELEDAIKQRIPNTQTTKVICRNGSLSDLADLHMCSLESARSVIINTQDDFTTIKSILAATNILKNADNKNTFITAVIREKSNYEAAVIAGEGYAEVLYFEDTIARIIAHTCRLPGLSSTYIELFDFDGDEIYLEHYDSAEGLTMKELNRVFPVSTVLGLEKNGEILLNPPTDTIYEKDDNLILLAEDDGVSVPETEKAGVDMTVIVTDRKNTPEPKQKMLILGYGPRLEKILEQEDEYMTKGSGILIAVQQEMEHALDSIKNTMYHNIRVDIQACDIYKKSELESLLAWNPQSVFVPSLLDEDPEKDDSKSLLLLLQLRAIAEEKGLKHTVTSEMRNIENQELAQITEVKDFVVSSNIVSLMLTQISQTRQLRKVFEELLASEGSEIYMRPASDYVKLNVPIDMYTASYSTTFKDQVFLGYRKMNDTETEFEIITNPDKKNIETFTEHDRFIVLSVD